jgi:hypothetical protein
VTEWKPVVKPGEPFADAIQRLTWEEAVRVNPRRPGESAEAWAERVRDAADGTTLADEEGAEKE